MTDPKKNKPAELEEDQLAGATGSDRNGDVITQPMIFKRCAANPEHV